MGYLEINEFHEFKINPGLLFFYSKAFSWIIFSILLRLSTLHKIVDKSDFKFCTNPELS